MKSKTGLTPEQTAQLSLILKKLGADEIILFGSRAKGNHRPGSDIDIALKGKNLDSSLLTQMESEYQKLYFPWKLDLVIYDTIKNKNLRDHIDRVGIRL